VLTDAEITYDGFESLTNTATTENSEGPDSDEGNNSASATTRVVPVTALWYGLPGARVNAIDQFGEISFDLYAPDGLLTPASIDLNDAPFFEGVHLMSYLIETIDWDPNFDDLLLENRFGQFIADTISPPHHLLVPTTKNLREFSGSPEMVPLSTVPHYLCYDVILLDAQSDQSPTSVSDQFGANRAVNLNFAHVVLCNPADKNGEGIENPAVPHLMCVESANVDPVVPLPGAFMRNQFGYYEEQIEREEFLCVATRKTHEDDCTCDDLSADLEVEKRAAADTSSPNRTNFVEYSVLITNNGPDTVMDIVVQDTLTMIAGTIVDVPETEFAATHGTGWSIVSQDFSSVTLEATIDVLAAGEWARLDFTVIVLIAPDQQVTEMNNTASAEGNLPDPDPTNNMDSVNTIIELGS
jgi:uncharacterized repeat protein (TIGR01451 family)